MNIFPNQYTVQMVDIRNPIAYMLYNNLSLRRRTHKNVIFRCRQLMYFMKLTLYFIQNEIR